MKPFLPQHALPQLIEKLSSCGEVFAPCKEDNGTARFISCSTGTIPDLTDIRTVLPPKKLLLHPSEIIARYSPENGYSGSDYEIKPWILLAVHPCDLAGIAYLDQLLLGEYRDGLYAARREALTLIGISCTPDQYCSCELSECTFPASCDLFFHTVDDGWEITHHTEHGLHLLQLLQPQLQLRSPHNNTDRRVFFGHSGNKRQNADWDHSAWQIMADRCIGCGACSVTCPTCSCFDVQESGFLHNDTAERIRNWDSCLLASHSRVAGSFSFQKHRRDRFKYRYRHKYIGFGELRGSISCTGCGRCRAFCPAEIDLRELARELGRSQP